MQSKLFLYGFTVLIFCILLSDQVPGTEEKMEDQRSHIIHMFFCGDVMTGRGIDQLLPHPGNPLLHESYMKDAGKYIELGEQAYGPVQKPAGTPYIWGDAIEELERMAPDVRLINLETSITRSDDHWKGKTVHYRMHPENIASIAAAGIDYASLANNHILDWGYAGLTETLETLKNANIRTAGAGRNLREAETPAVIPIAGKGRVVVLSYGSVTSGIPLKWAASKESPGVNLVNDLSDETVRQIKNKISGFRQEGDIVVLSIHWGANWGYDIPAEQTEFAHNLIDHAGVDVIHGHSSHHVKGIEVYKGRLIIYGCGDFLNDYEGIPGYERYRDDLGLMYFVSVEASTGRLVRLHMTPTQIRHFRVNRAEKADVLWMRDTLNREGEKFGTRVELNADNTVTLHWEEPYTQ